MVDLNAICECVCVCSRSDELTQRTRIQMKCWNQTPAYSGAQPPGSMPHQPPDSEFSFKDLAALCPFCAATFWRWGCGPWPPERLSFQKALVEVLNFTFGISHKIWMKCTSCFFALAKGSPSPWGHLGVHMVWTGFGVCHTLRQLTPFWSLVSSEGRNSKLSWTCQLKPWPINMWAGRGRG